MPLMTKIEKTETVGLNIDIIVNEAHRTFVSLAVPVGLDDEAVRDLVQKRIDDGIIDVWDDSRHMHSETESVNIEMITRKGGPSA